MSSLWFYRKLRSFNIIYDIACQYSKYFMSRISKDTFPPHIRDDINLEEKLIRFFIDKFHEEAHGCAFKEESSLYTSKNVGRTHGSTMEQEWAHSKALAPATREMGNGARQFTLDVQWGSWNFELTVTMGKRLSFSSRLPLTPAKVPVYTMP
jgi:hypothetical protein